MESWTVLQEVSLGTWVTAGGVWIAAIAASIAAILLGRLVALLEGGRRVSGDTRRWQDSGGSVSQPRVSASGCTKLGAPYTVFDPTPDQDGPSNPIEAAEFGLPTLVRLCYDA